MSKANGVGEANSMDAAGPKDTTPPPASQSTAGQVTPVINFPPGLDEAFLLDWIRRTKARFKKFAKPEFQRMEESHKMFNSEPIGGMNKAGTFVPIVNSVIETDTARRVTSMFSRPKVVDAVPQSVPPTIPDPTTGEPIVDDENKLLVEDLINQEILASDARTVEKGFDCMKGLGIEGTFVAKVYWEFTQCEKTVPTMRIDPMSGQPIQTGERVVPYKKGRPNWMICAMQNMVWDPRVSSRIADSKYIGYETFETLNELLLQEQSGEITGVQEMVKTVSPVADPEEKDQELKRKKALGEEGGGRTDVDDPLYSMMEWFAWLTWEMPNEADDTKTWTTECFRFRVINDQKVVKFEVNPLKKKRMPFISGRYSIRPRQFLGNAVTQPIKGLQIYTNNLMGSKQDLIRKASQNPTFYERGSGLDGRKTILTEGSMIPVLDANKVKHFPVDTAAIAVTSQEQDKQINLMRETTAANEQSQGIQGSADNTATQEAIMAQSAATRFQAVADLSGYEFFAGLAQEFYLHIQQFNRPGDLVVRESSIDGLPRQVTPQDVMEDYLFIPVTAAAQMNRDNLAKKQMEVLSQITQTPPQFLIDNQGNQFQFDAVEFYIKEIMPLAGIKSGRTYWKKTPMTRGMAGAAAGAPGGVPTAEGQPPQGPGGPAGLPKLSTPAPLKRFTSAS